LGTTPDDERNPTVADAVLYVARFRVAKPGCRAAKRAALSTTDPGSPAANRATSLLQKLKVNAVSFTLTLTKKPNAEAQPPPEREARREPKPRQRVGRSAAATCWVLYSPLPPNG